MKLKKKTAKRTLDITVLIGSTHLHNSFVMTIGKDPTQLELYSYSQVFTRVIRAPYSSFLCFRHNIFEYGSTVYFDLL